MSRYANLPKKALRRVLLLPRQMYLITKRRRVVNTSPSIISNNCLAGIVLSDLKLRFNTPTINLYFTREDFVVFVQNLTEYLSLDMQEDMEAEEGFPVGRLSGSAGDVRVYFMHYGSFTEAKSKWVERSGRVDLGNLYIVMHANPETSRATLEAFDALEFDHKVVLSPGPRDGVSSLFPISYYESAHDPQATIFDYPGPYSIKRYLDEFDFVSFINSGRTSARQ